VIGEQGRSEQRRFVCTTSWDDGSVHDLRLAELLATYGLPGTFYVPLSNSRPTLSPAELRWLSQQFEIGAHTVNHVRLRGLANSQAQREVADSKKQLEDILGKPCSIFCFPGGSYSKIHFRMLREAGFVAARTVELLSLERPRTIDGIAVIPTTIQAYPHRTGSYLRNAAKRFSVEAVWNLLRGGRTRSWSAFAAVLLNRAANISGVFHLWGHSWEIEETGQWQALDQTLAAISEYRQYASLLTNMELCSDVGKAADNPRPALVS
jgi:peptidoglycan/xylan/chitin deacetylase (PgdA/CDA1 family)